MSETAFPINDLLRRKFQTTLIVVSIALCVASTLFLLLFGDKLGFGVLSAAGGRLTAGVTIVFSQLILFIEVLMFVVGIVIISFLAFVMMSQRVRDIGLMKAAGCPSDMAFGYFASELLIVALIGSLLGVAIGTLADFASTLLLNNIGFQIGQKPINLWIVLLVFAIFSVFGIVFGLRPVLSATRVEPAKAVSPAYHLGLSKEPGFKPVSRAQIAIKIGLRSLARRKSATFRIVICMAGVFVLLTVAIAGGVIADQTSRSWVEKAIGRNMILVAHRDMVSRYKLLLSSFYEPAEKTTFNYTNKSYLLSEDLLTQLATIPSIKGIDPRLVLELQVVESRWDYVDPETMQLKSVGDSRKGESLIVGVDPSRVVGEWVINGRFLNQTQPWEAVIGDSLAHRLFDEPLIQQISVGTLYRIGIAGVCLDPINNGNVTYVPLRTLQVVVNVSRPNLVMLKIESSADQASTLSQIRAAANAANSDFEVFELDEMLNKSLNFLGYLWGAVMLLPLFSLAAASLCLIGYVMLAITEQRQEFGVLRALGVKPSTVVKIVSFQNLLVLLSSCAAGIGFGIVLTLIILIPDPIVTSLTVLEIAGWLLTALAAMFLVSLYPAVRFSKKSIMETVA